MSDPTPPAVSDAMREAVAPYIALFDVAYRKACEGSMEPDWCNAALLGQQMRNAFFKAIGPDGPIASEIARLTGERDAALADQRTMLIQVGEHARARGEAEGALWISEKAGIVEGWRARAEAAEAETARLRAALEFYGDEAAWSGHPWRLTFESPGRDGHGPDVARAALSSQEQADV